MRVLIFGASSGVGEALTRLCSGKGWEVFAAARRKDKLDQIAAEAENVMPVVCDVTQSSPVVDAFKQATKNGQLDAVINTASPYIWDRPLETITDQEWEEIVTNYSRGSFYVTREAKKLLLHQGHGTVVMISSLGGIYDKVHPGKGPYSALKAMQVYLMATADQELGRKKLRAFAVCPGLIEDTPLVAKYLEQHPDDMGKGIKAKFAASEIAKIINDPSSYKHWLYELGKTGLVQAKNLGAA